MDKLRTKPLHVNQNASIGISQIISRARNWKRQRKVPDYRGIVAVDYLQLVQYEVHSRRNEAAELKNIAYGLARLAKELKVVVLAIAQFRNDAEGQRPAVRFIEGSGGIAQAAEGMLLLDLLSRRKDDMRPTDEWEPMDIIVHQRNGESNATVELSVDLSTSKFVERTIYGA